MRGRPVAPVRWVFGAMDSENGANWFSAVCHFISILPLLAYRRDGDIPGPMS